MEIIRSHKIRLRPTEDQKRELNRTFAAARHAWNWGKEILDFEYDLNRLVYRETGENYSFSPILAGSKTTGQRSLKTLYYRTRPDWTRGTGTAAQEAFGDLQKTLRRYFDIRKGKIKINLKTGEDGKVKSRKDNRHHGWLNWRSKKNHNSFRATNGTKIKELEKGSKTICYAASVGYIRMCEPLRFDGKIMNATFSYDGKWYWASIQVQMEKPIREPNFRAVGVDLGVKYLSYTSDGDFIENPKAYYQIKRKLRRLQRKLDRQRRANNPDCYNENGTIKKGKRPIKMSNQMIRTDNKIKALHTRARNIRRNKQHQLTAEIAKGYGFIFIEDLNVNGMLKNSKLAKAIADAGFREIRRQFEYKAEFYSGMVGVVDTWFPSSKLCSGCGHKKLDLALSDRFWTCEQCGQYNERDLNAAINLRNEGIRLYVNPDLLPAGSPVTA